MQKLHESTIRQLVVDGVVVYFCITGQQSALFYNREQAEKWLRDKCIIR